MFYFADNQEFIGKKKKKKSISQLVHASKTNRGLGTKQDEVAGSMPTIDIRRLFK